MPRYFIAKADGRGTQNEMNPSNGFSLIELNDFLLQNGLTRIGEYRIGPIVNVLVK